MSWIPVIGCDDIQIHNMYLMLRSASKPILPQQDHPHGCARAIPWRVDGDACPSPTMAVPIFEGVRVVELATVLAAPSCAMQMALFGAEVVKIEGTHTGTLAPLCAF